MSLSRFKNLNKIRATKLFTDRNAPLKVFKSSLNDYIDEKYNYFKVIVYYGTGGIGKSTLLKKIADSIPKNNPSYNALKLTFINLDTYEFDTPIDILLSIRNKLDINCSLFDIAILSYWEKVGVSGKVLKEHKKIKNNSIIWDIVDFVSPVSSSLIKKSIDFLIKQQNKYFSEFKLELNEIEELNVSEIEERLPYYLGICINREYKKINNLPIIIFDAFETMNRKLINKSVVADTESWIREFIASIEFGLFVIASREYLKWSAINPDWEQFIEQHILGQLSDEDAKYFLQNIPIEDKSIVNAIVKVSNGIPLYLDLCVNIFLRKKASKIQIKKEDFMFPRDEVIKRFLKHLEKEEKEILKVLSQVNFFDYKLFKYLNAKFQIGYPTSLFFENSSISIVEKLDEDFSLYKIHDYIRAHLKYSLKNDLRIDIIKEYIYYFSTEKETYSSIVFKKYIGNILSSLTVELQLSTKDVENILTICFYLIDKGYWIDLQKGLKQSENDILRKNPILKNAFLLINSIIIRRTSNIELAVQLLNTANPDKNTLGYYYESFIFNKANYTRLSGNYISAKRTYKNLLLNTNNLDKRLAISIKNQYADLLFLEGSFVKSIKILKEISLDINLAEYFAINRTKGHIFRFNFMYEKSFDIYKELYYKVIKNDAYNSSLKGKILTNLTEINCWFSPSKAIEFGIQSIDVNSSIKAKIELGKTATSISIAYLLIGDIDNAKIYIRKAFYYQNETGYKSGLLFAEIANFFIFFKEKSFDNLRQSKIKIENLINQLNVYRFLYLPIALIYNETNIINDLKNNIEWLNFQDICNMYNDKIINNIKLK